MSTWSSPAAVAGGSSRTVRSAGVLGNQSVTGRCSRSRRPGLAPGPCSGYYKIHGQAAALGCVGRKMKLTGSQLSARAPRITAHM